MQPKGAFGLVASQVLGQGLGHGHVGHNMT